MGTSKISAFAAWCFINSACAGILPATDSTDADMARIQEDSRQRQIADEQRRAKQESEAQSEMARLSQESQVRENTQRQAASCRPRWRPIEIEKARQTRLKPKPSDTRGPPAGIPNAPSELHKTFARHAEALEKQRAAGCDVVGREDFDIEWSYLQQEEAARIVRLQEHAARVASERAEKEAQRAAFEEQSTLLARKKGFDRVEFGRSLTEVLQTLIEEAAPVTTLRKVAIEVGFADQGFLAQQSLSSGQGIFASSETEIRLWFVAPGTSVYEGTPLISFVSEEMPFFTITGVKSYRTVAGSLTQAFIVKPAW